MILGEEEISDVSFATFYEMQLFAAADTGELEARAEIMERQMAHMHQWFFANQFDLQPGKSATAFWDIPNNLWFTPATWTISAYPETALDPPYPAEQRVEITNVFLLRKGPDVAPSDQRGLQLNYSVHNRGTHPAKGGLVISAVTA